MGGFGALSIALAHPDRFAVAESWLGFFNGLEPALRVEGPTLRRLGLHAFLYGGALDRIADADENPAFARALRAAGADAESAVYPGAHDFATLEAHLPHMLVFAARGLSGSS
jgi:S-formylglutathione hydrolase FrmB